MWIYSCSAAIMFATLSFAAGVGRELAVFVCGFYRQLYMSRGLVGSPYLQDDSGPYEQNSTGHPQPWCRIGPDKPSRCRETSAVRAECNLFFWSCCQTITPQILPCAHLWGTGATLIRGPVVYIYIYNTTPHNRTQERLTLFTLMETCKGLELFFGNVHI